MKFISVLTLFAALVTSSASAHGSEDPSSWYQSRINLALQLLRQTDASGSDKLRESLHDVTVKSGQVPVEIIHDPLTGKSRLPPDYTGADRQVTTGDDGKDYVFITLSLYYQEAIQGKWQRLTKSAEMQKKLEAVDCFELLFGKDSPELDAIKKSVNLLMMNDYPKINYGHKGN